VDSYGLADRKAPRPALQRSVLAGAEHIAYWPVGAAGADRSLEYLAQELRWLESLSPDPGHAL